MAERWPALMSRREAAEYLGTSVETISMEKANGKIKSVMLRGTPKYSREALDEYIRSLPEGSGKCAAAEARERKRQAERNQKRESRRKKAEQPTEQPAA
jgi:excisionase family DNA binding protein